MLEKDINMNYDHPIILFDGRCYLCSGSVMFILKRERKRGEFRFASLQSKKASELLGEKKELKDKNESGSVILIENGRIYSKSTAALRITRKLRRGWPLLYGFIVVPRFIRDGIYNWIAKNRFKWFGKMDKDFIPPEGTEDRFLDR